MRRSDFDYSTITIGRLSPSTKFIRTAKFRRTEQRGASRICHGVGQCGGTWVVFVSQAVDDFGLKRKSWPIAYVASEQEAESMARELNGGHRNEGVTD